MNRGPIAERRHEPLTARRTWLVIATAVLAPLALTGIVLLAGVPIAYATFSTLLATTAATTIADLAGLMASKGRPAEPARDRRTAARVADVRPE